MCFIFSRRCYCIILYHGKFPAPQPSSPLSWISPLLWPTAHSSVGRSLNTKKKKQKIAIGKCVYKWFILSPHSTLRGSPIFCCFETLERRKKEKTKKKNNSISEFTKDEALRILALYLLLLTYSPLCPVVSSTFVLIYFFVGRVFSPLVCYPCHLVYELMAASLVTPMAHSTP